MSTKDLGDLGVAAGDIIDKAFTLGYETGRKYIPAGGMAFTAEQVEDVRIVLGLNGSQDIKVVLDAQARLRALFPATEPAEEAPPCAICNVNETNHAGVSYYHPFTAELGPFDDDGNDRPAPAEPAEEETKAERRDPDALAKRMAWIWHDGWDTCGERERDYLRRAAEMAHSYYFSSPVVPAPTETGPWPSLNDVPAEVSEVWDANGDGWLRRSDIEWFGCAEGGITSACRAGHPNLAPFVAAEEG